ncbi:UNVERIFIED_CONTAM: hypothetical protein Sangu_3103600 [Sesamum angustifolium]|uniref:Uncharacterized protein n=1 Tax=Sesamum angustifolium TaxID=2727405 RepID=A0AAW2K743_9LAMI
MIDEDLLELKHEVDSIEGFTVIPGWVDESPTGALDNIILANLNELQDTLNDTTSLWNFIEEYFPSVDDEADSILALPGTPCPLHLVHPTPPPTPNSSYASGEHPSTTASNDIPNSN